MKSLIILSFLFIHTFAFAGEELESEELRQLTCDSINKTNYNISEKMCLNGSITIEESAYFTFNNKEYNSMLIVLAQIKDTKAMVELNRSLTITSEGIVKGKWSVKTLEINVGLFHKILSASTNSSHVNELKSDRNVPSKIKAFAQNYIKDLGDYSFTISYYTIKDSGKKIGYIAYVWYESESDDIKGYAEQNFDLKGTKVGETTEESFGYYE